MTRLMTAGASMCAIFLIVGACDPYSVVTVLTDAPPGRVAEVDAEAGSIRLSQGVAVAVECEWIDYDEETEVYQRMPCAALQARADDEDAVTVYDAHVDAASPLVADGAASPVDGEGRDRAVVVLVGRAPSDTTLELEHDGETLTFDLIIEAPRIETESAEASSD